VPQKKPSYFIDPFGCVKNQVDSENMMLFMEKAGWERKPAEEADLIIVNSCGFIESAKQESINAVIGWRNLYPGKKILLAGCLAERYANELAESLTEADGFMGVKDIKQIDRIARNIINASCDSGSQPLSDNLTGARPLLSLPGSAYVKISEGCDNRCSYCAIPLIRGRLKSRTIPDIQNECRTLLARGIKELCIVAQDTGSFGRDVSPDGKLPQLLNAIGEIDGAFWVRLLYIHPDHFPLSILDIIEKDTRFLPYFDIPFQHASEKILRAMNRKGNAAGYLELLNNIRTRLPDAVIRSTFLLGFPDETEEDFAELLDFQEKAALDWLGCFAYSREENTAAWSMKKRISKKTAAARKQIIEEKQISITQKKMDRFAGRTLDVLIEEHMDENLAIGRLYLQAPEIDGAAVIQADRLMPQAGSLVPCKATARRGIDLEVRLLIKEH